MSNFPKHDRQEVIDRAMQVFWANGYHATSMRQLQDAVDLRPGSIYSSFGGKESLFRMALKHYANLAMVQLQACQAENASPMAALRAFVRNDLLHGNTAPSSICLLVKTATELTQLDGVLLEDARSFLAGIRNAFCKLFEEAKACGELTHNAQPARLASYFQMQVIGLKAMSRLQSDSCITSQMIEDLFNSLDTVKLSTTVNK
jgi:TetR/AcrR family transcriptional regulator, transcriptional repressor for nem operon